MSFLSNLFSSRKTDQSSYDSDILQNKASLLKKHLYISVDFISVKFLGIDEGVTPHRILARKEVMCGPFENLEEGKMVRDIYDVLGKILSQELELIKSYGNFSCAISAEGVFFRTITLPKLDVGATQKTLLAEIKSTLPVDFSQVLFAQNDLGEIKENTRTYFCVLIQKATFEKFKEVFNKFTISPYFEIDTFSLARIPVRDENYKLIVHVGKANTYLIFTRGQIIQSIEVLEMGDNKISNSIENNLGIPYRDVCVLRQYHTPLSEEGRLGGQILDEYVKEFNKTLSKAITLHILEFEKMIGGEVKDLIITGSDASPKLKKNIHDEFDAELSVEFVKEDDFGQFISEDFLEEELKKYSVNFGLAKRVK